MIPVRADRGAGDPLGFLVTVPGPAERIVADGGMKAGGVQDALHMVAVVALLEERKGDPAGPAPSVGMGCFVEPGRGQVCVH